MDENKMYLNINQEKCFYCLADQNLAVNKIFYFLPLLF